MNNLLKLLALTIGFFITAIVPLSCSSDESAEQDNVDLSLPGKIYVHTYNHEDVDVHESGMEILEFRSDDSVYRYNFFCLLAGDYLQMFDGFEKSRFGIVGNSVMLGLKDTISYATLFYDNGKTSLDWTGEGIFESSKLSVEANRKQFQRVHTHEMLDPIVKPGDSLLTVENGGRYIACSGRKSFIINVTGVSGSHATNDQSVSFTVQGIPGDFELSEAKGIVYLMKFGTLAYAPVDRELAESNPADVVAILSCDGSTKDNTIVCPFVDKSFKGAVNHTSFGKLNPRLY